MSIAHRMAGWLLLVGLLAPVAASGQTQEKPPLKPEEIEALVAPIALYPDSLLSQVLMASTYPLEIVQAARWVQANPKVTGDAALKAVEKEAWDVSVKSLVAFPQILAPMNEKLDWTQKLGDAFLAQKEDVMSAVQRLRQQAHQSGNLKSNEQQKVTVEQAPAAQQTVIKVEQAKPDVIYVPAYDPTVVYGGWPYPAYPPYYWPPPPMYYPGGYLAAGFAFGIGVVTIGAIFGDCDWGNNDINIDVDKAVNIDRNFQSNRPDRGQGQGERTNWQHDPSHRKGVSYRDQATRDRYSAGVPGADARRDYRGHAGGGPQVSGGAAGDRGPQAGGGALGDRAPGASTLPAGPGGARSDGRGDSGGAFAGVGAGGQTQRDAERGRASTQSLAANRPTPAARPSAGASRPAGGRAGGGGRRR